MIATSTARRTALRAVLGAGSPECADARRLNVEGFAAAAGVAYVGVVELEPLVQALAREVELGALEVRQALRIDDDAHAVALELRVLGPHVVGVLDLVREAGASGRTHADAQPDALPAPREVRRDVARRILGERDGHGVNPPRAPVRPPARPRASICSRPLPP